MSDPLHTLVLHRSEKTKNKILSKLLDTTICSICHDYMFVPMTTECGHSYCYTCLKTWFSSDTNRGGLSCPECRAIVNRIPIVNTALQSWLNNTLDILGVKKNDDDRYKKLMSAQSAEVRTYQDDKKADDLFGNIFKSSAQAIADESDDGIIRCSNCLWELDVDEDTNECPNCSARIRNGIPRGNGTSESTREDLYNRDEYSEGEYEEIEDELRNTGVVISNGRIEPAHLPEGYEEDDFSYDDEDEDTPISGSRRQHAASRFSSANMRSRLSLHDDEAEEEDDDDNDSGHSIAEQEEAGDYDNEERDSDLDSFIADDDEVLEEEPEEVQEIRSSAEDDNHDSDFYEKQPDSFVSGDSLDDESSAEEHGTSPKRQKRFRIVLDESDDEE
ncbi:uncharacterized protein GVI51_I09845 [Nakaseomyces glabratus]|uniref:RING-type domain-containing protein n=2 Tax=Candida glabrata TaxID=5478 RepID=Q6FQ13_CANGA|nr:uncharacterized protein CAGL0I09988g [Nakaseomyces glabratus]KAH7585110.1 Zinc finger RING-type profile [Nakaseomyces glabratus]KAH7598768.1 Zinc finger RING-type profile [Nakaseomyces glabratus]KAH7599942.1 Zinc finger RING-type profile [Nakaseomyces glabratus]KAH7604774.1 Zinc finger RING-type profile [Nakaseomyces glabratus]KAH7613041.1 Zinc finger RING-type profile [Nakaseomyces glabratus]|eukprot:XP_447681.1 uncharacterized protein CAGL0I09988g [[Candida] glabrata]